MTYLSEDIWYIVCAQLWQQRDFDTLFNCVCSGKQLATIAVAFLYRMHDIAPVTNGGSNEVIPPHNQPGSMDHAMRSSAEERIFMKWVGLWQTIILSSLDATFYSYCQYFRTLNLHDLEELITHSRFSAKIRKDFYQTVDGPRFQLIGMNRMQIIATVGEVITKQTPLLEKLTGSVVSSVLRGWIPRLPQLTHLKLSHVRGISGNGTLIRRHCPLFKRLDILQWSHINWDQCLAASLNDLRPQSLESFSYHDLGPESFQALSRHGKSLTELRLGMLKRSSISELSLLKVCSNLVSLSLGTRASRTARTDLQNPLNAEMAWLKECKKLRILSFDRAFIASALIAPTLLEQSIQLTSLKWDSFVEGDNQIFYRALANQTSLKTLWLNLPTGYLPYHIDLPESLSRLVHLTNLHLEGDRPTVFDNVKFASSLPKLEFLAMKGCGITKGFWGDVASLKSVRSLELDVLTIFTVTADPILDFVKQLGAGNQGLFLSVKFRGMANRLSGVEEQLIREMIAQRVGGRFEIAY